MPDASSDAGSPTSLLKCLDCGASAYGDHFDSLDVECGHCAHAFTVDLPLAVQSRRRQGALDLGFSALTAWTRSIAAIATSPDSLLLEECPACGGIVTVPDTTPVHLSCRACGSVRALPIGEHAIDLIPDGRFQLEMRMGPGRFLEIRTQTDHRVVGLDEDAGCPACGAPIPHFDGEHRCGSCDSLILAWSRCGKRFFPGMIVEGHINRQPLSGWYSLTEVQRRLADPLAGMEPAMAVLADVPKIIGRGARSVLTLVAVMFGLFWMLGMLD